MQPIFPMEPISCDIIPQGPDWIAQVKWDGVRVLTYSDDLGVRLYNRKLNERTLHYPEIAAIDSYCTAHSVILDGEVIAFGPDGKPSFYEVMRRDGLRRMEKVPQLQKVVAITYMIFDVLYLNGEWVTSSSLSERQGMLRTIIKPNPRIQLVENFTDTEALFDVVQAQKMEGIVIKDLNSRYVMNKKVPAWQKKKVYRDLIAVIGGVTVKNGIVNSLLLGLYDKDGAFWYIGHAGTGKLTQQDWRTLTEQIQPLIRPVRPFANQPPRTADTVWLHPELTAKIHYAEWVPGHSLRQPSIQAIVNIPPHQCTLE